MDPSSAPGSNCGDTPAEHPALETNPASFSKGRGASGGKEPARDASGKGPLGPKKVVKELPKEKPPTSKSSDEKFANRLPPTQPKNFPRGSHRGGLRYASHQRNWSPTPLPFPPPPHLRGTNVQNNWTNPRFPPNFNSGVSRNQAANRPSTTPKFFHAPAVVRPSQGRHIPISSTALTTSAAAPHTTYTCAPAMPGLIPASDPGATPDSGDASISRVQPTSGRASAPTPSTNHSYFSQSGLDGSGALYQPTPQEPFVGFRWVEGNEFVDLYPKHGGLSSYQKTLELLKALEEGTWKRVIVQPLWAKTYEYPSDFMSYLSSLASNSGAATVVVGGNKPGDKAAKIGFSQPTNSSDGGSTTHSQGQQQRELLNHYLTGCHGCGQYLLQTLDAPARRKYPYLIFMEPRSGPGFFFHIDCFETLYDSVLLLPNYLHLVDAAPENENQWGLLVRMWFATSGMFDLEAAKMFMKQHELYEAQVEAVVRQRVAAHLGHAHASVADTNMGPLAASRRAPCGCTTMLSHPVLLNAGLRTDLPPIKLSYLLRQKECELMKAGVVTKLLRAPPGLGMQDIITQDYGLPMGPSMEG